MKIALRDFLRKYRNALITFFRCSRGVSDLKRWSDPASLSSDWDERTKLLASFVDPGMAVLEFGAGRMVLRNFLPAGCTYTPSDIVDRGEGTLVCDLNAPKLPDFFSHDAAVFSGVIEYVNDVPRLILHLSRFVKVIIVSYVVFESLPDIVERRAHGWVNDFSTSQIEELFAKAGYVLDTTTAWQPHKIFRFVRGSN